jgi:hypothetical protein
VTSKTTVAVFVHAPAGRMAVGLRADVSTGLRFVAGRRTGQEHVHDLATGQDRAPTSSPAQRPSLLMWPHARGRMVHGQFARSSIHPGGPGGSLGPARTLLLTGPAADTSASINLNGLAVTPDGATLIVAHSGTGKLHTVNPATAASAVIAGVGVPDVDGILLEAGRLWAVQNFLNQIAEVQLSSDLSSAVVNKVITSPRLRDPDHRRAPRGPTCNYECEI